MRLPIETVLNQALKGNIPGRKIDNDWRFLRSAIDNWLSSQDSRSILLSQVGAFADDNSLAQLRNYIYQARGRSETEENFANE